MARNKRDPLVGTVVAGRFHVKRPLAAGGMAQVYVARDGESGPRVALKVLHRPSARLLRELLTREAEALALLDHPNIVGYVSHGPHQDGVYLAMELVDQARPITTYLRQNNDRPLDALPLLDQLLSALEHLHSRGIVHRDVKSSNVLVTDGEKGPHVTLVDFGIAKVEGREEVKQDAPLLGGVHTSSPEQIRGEPIGPQSDLYSFGILAFRLLSGAYPFHSKVPAEVFGMHLNGAIPELPDTLPEPLRRSVRQCLAKQPADRPTDVASLRTQWQPAFEPSAGAQTPWWPVVAVVLLLLAVLYGFFA